MGLKNNITVNLNVNILRLWDKDISDACALLFLLMTTTRMFCRDMLQ